MLTNFKTRIPGISRTLLRRNHIGIFNTSNNHLNAQIKTQGYEQIHKGGWITNPWITNPR